MGLWLELGQFNEDKFQAGNGLLLIAYFDDLVMVVVVCAVRNEVAVDDGQGIDGLQECVVLPLFELLDIGVGSPKEHTLIKVGAPDHLHLDDKDASLGVFAFDVHDGVFFDQG